MIKISPSTLNHRVEFQPERAPLVKLSVMSDQGIGALVRKIQDLFSKIFPSLKTHQLYISPLIGPVWATERTLNRFFKDVANGQVQKPLLSDRDLAQFRSSNKPLIVTQENKIDLCAFAQAAIASVQEALLLTKGKDEALDVQWGALNVEPKTLHQPISVSLHQDAPQVVNAHHIRVAGSKYIATKYPYQEPELVN